MALFPFMQRIPVRAPRPIPETAPKGTASRDASLKVAFEAAGVGLATATLDGHWLNVNDTCCHLLGYTREELVRYSLNDLTHPDDAKKELVLIKRVLAGDSQRYRIEKRLMDKSGGYRTLLVTAALAPGDVFVYVIELPNKASESGQDAGRLAINILERLPQIAVVRCDARGNVTGWSSGAERIFGYKRDEILGKSRRSFYRDQDSWEDRPLVHMRIAAEQGSLAGDDFRVHRDGRHMWVHSELSVYAPDGNVRGYVEVLSQQEGVVSIDTSAAMAKLREELDGERLASAQLQEQVEQLMMRGAQHDQELRVLAGALRKEIERREEAESLVRGLVVELATPQRSDQELKTIELDVEPSWLPLEARGAARLLLETAAQERTGTLLISGPSHKALFFNRGRLTCVASDDPADFLGERLLRNGAITAVQRAKTLQLVESTGLAFGRCLILLGIMTEESAREAMRAKLYDEIDALAAWTDCRWSFVQRELPHRKMLQLSIDVRDLPAVRALKTERVESFVATKNGTRYHRATCMSVQRVAPAQQIVVAGIADASARGLQPCRICTASA
jgi:PAS domain S-box-containing protein